MSYLEGLLLGIVEGLTEFLPISSSGHLILAREVLGLNVPEGLTVDAVLQLAATLAVAVYFFVDFRTLFATFTKKLRGLPVLPEDSTLFLAIALGTIPGLLLGIVLEEYMDTVFRNALLVAFALLFGSALMYIAERFARGGAALSVKNGFLIGCFQALALVPGVSRSGATIAGGLFLGLSREAAARFSFLLSFPIILGSGSKKLWELWQGGDIAMQAGPLLLAFLTAFAVGLASIHWLISYLRTHTLSIFIWYRVALAFVVIGFLFA